MGPEEGRLFGGWRTVYLSKLGLVFKSSKQYGTLRNKKDPKRESTSGNYPDVASAARQGFSSESIGRLPSFLISLDAAARNRI